MRKHDQGSAAAAGARRATGGAAGRLFEEVVGPVSAGASGAGMT